MQMKTISAKKGLLIILVVCNVTIAYSQKVKKALFIIADGIPADALNKVKTPALDAIAKQGGYTDAYVGGKKNGYSQTPTISAVGYNSLLTGTWVNKHNVWDNDIKRQIIITGPSSGSWKMPFPQKEPLCFLPGWIIERNWWAMEWMSPAISISTIM